MNNDIDRILQDLIHASGDFKPLSASEKQNLSHDVLREYEAIEILSGWNYHKFSMLTLKKHHFTVPASNDIEG